MTPNSSGNNRAVNIVSKTVNTRLRNNILVTTGGLPILKTVPGQTGILFQDNDYYSSGAAFKINWAGTTYNSLSAWRTGTGQEKLNGINTGTDADPKLANPGGTGAANYKLTAASPLIDAGMDLNQLFNINPGPVDYFGTKIPYNGKFDIGAHEYTGN
jgi:hypothetical protein